MPMFNIYLDLESLALVKDICHMNGYINFVNFDIFTFF